MAKLILRILESLFSLALGLALVLAGSYSAYALWDNNQIYTAAENVQSEMLSLKPTVGEDEEEGPSFAELLAVNPDVCAWLELDGTHIDYPVLQGEDNLSYINTDVYGNFALAGSIFLDSGCDNTFMGAYNLVHGHHMEASRMFGDLDLYKERKFFNENTTGALLLPNKTYKLEIFACLVDSSAEHNIYDVYRWQTDINGLMDYVCENAMYVHQETIDRLLESESPRVLAMSTCSSEYTNARTILLAAMVPQAPGM